MHVCACVCVCVHVHVSTLKKSSDLKTPQSSMRALEEAGTCRVRPCKRFSRRFICRGNETTEACSHRISPSCRTSHRSLSQIFGGGILRSRSHTHETSLREYIPENNSLRLRLQPPSCRLARRRVCAYSYKVATFTERQLAGAAPVISGPAHSLKEISGPRSC